MSSESSPPLIAAQLNHLALHFPLLAKIEAKWSGSKDYSGVLDRFTLAISYCLDFIKWDVIFDAEYPMSAPDIIFGPEDESFQQFLVLHGEDPKSPMNRLGGWDSRDPTQLMLLVQELRDQYMAYQMKRVGEVQDDRVKFEISTIAFREGIEMHLSSGYDKPEEVKFAVPLVDTNINKMVPGCPWIYPQKIYLQVIYPVEKKYVSTPSAPRLKLVATPDLKTLFSIDDVKLPTWLTGMCMAEYLPPLEETLEKQVLEAVSLIDVRRLVSSTKLKDFRIIDNSFSGKIPNYIQNWTNLHKLGIQANGLTGPIPSGISLLTSLTDLRITDLNGPESSFPLLEDMKNLKILMLRSCNINGQLPEYFSYMTELTTLDLSFNKLTGKVPRSFVAPTNNLDYIFLTGNLLNGSEPLWMVGENVDLSYNNFTITSGPVNCQPQAGWNLFSSSSKGNSSAVSCLSNKTTTCSKRWYSLNINCGGSGVTIDGTTYDEDTVANGPSSYYMSSTNWVSSSTGYFPDDDSSTDHFTWSNNSSRLSMVNGQLYTTARLSPISLTYYGFCLLNGNYTVNLHFAEIMFTNGPTYSSLGRRIFDVYIQGIRVLKDFNIADEAGGAGKAVIKEYIAAVTTNTLEISFFWAGKGTTGLPVRGVYGPLISAISVVPADFEPPAETPSGPISMRLSIGAVVGSMAAGGVLLVLLILGYLWWRGYLRRERTLEQDLKGVDLQTGRFSLRQIKDATENFDIANKIGEGGFGPVYKGQLSDGTVIAVKQLSAKSKQGNREFVNEIGMISSLQHPHLVKLYGCCIEGNQLLLVYEYMENNSVGRALFGAKESQLKLDWPTRHRICVGVAKGLAYLHEESRLKIVHRDIKATNVLLDKNLCPKISDFGLAKLGEDDSTHISTRIAGTYGYMAPEYAMRGYLTDKADVYSFGILVLEMVSGRCNTTYHSKGECFYILDWALLLKEKGSLLDLVDPRLGSDFNKEDVMITIKVALLCCNVSAALRPAMSSVVSMLEGRARVEELVLDSSASSHEISETRKHFESNYSLETIAGSTQRQMMSIEEACTSPTSVQDHPINPHSDYWENRN